ncbi:MAG: AarF/ABC1/UbiB kinase family protein, partial [Thermoleophilia bacterium]|nr:AarF/ABC1/UbiB kinase family protein [Thermoleophilia bacterium]
MMADRVPTGRIGRLARVGYAAAGQAVRQAGTRTANVARSEEEAAAARERPPNAAAAQTGTLLG